MPSKTVTRWTCSRCHVTEEHDERRQPMNWVRINRAMPPLHAEPVSWGDFCASCWGVIQSAMHVDGTPAPATIDVLRDVLDEHAEAVSEARWNMENNNADQVSAALVALAEEVTR